MKYERKTNPMSAPEEVGLTQRNLLVKKKWWITAPLVIVGAMLLATLVSGPHDAQSVRRPSSEEWVPRISAMGAIARGDVPRPTAQQLTPRMGTMPWTAQRTTALPNGGADVLVHDAAAADFQSENVVAVNGNQVVVGYNDMRGFLSSPTSVCGVSYSTDAGATFTDGGQLPTAGGGDEVLGDPDVKTWFDGAATTYFFFSSLYKTAAGEYSLCLHVSTNGGQTWTGPREVTPATSLTDFPDKPLMGVDPETGRIFLAWTNFGTLVTVRCSYSDDQGQSWSTPVEFPSIGQGAVPRASESSDDVYVAWLSGGTIQVAKSVDNGASFAASVTAADDVVVPRSAYGSDRTNSFPSLAVDDGAVYVTYASVPVSAKASTGDFSDVYFVKSTGAAFSDPAVISGNTLLSDRAQFFPYVDVDSVSGDIAILYYDQVRGADGTHNQDLTEVFVAVSTNGGNTFQCPVTLSDRPFHAETGNTATAANLGEYSQCVFEDGTLYAAFTKTDLPTNATFAPDTYFDSSTPAGLSRGPTLVTLVSFNETGCIAGNRTLEPGETGNLIVTLGNFSLCTTQMRNGEATLSTTNPDIVIVKNTAKFPRIGFIGDTKNNAADPFVIRVPVNTITDPFVPMQLSFTSDQGDAELFFDLEIGEPNDPIVFSEDFDGPGFPALPPGWTTSTVAGVDNPWERISGVSSSGTQSAFCPDLPVTSHSRLASPVIATSAFDEYVLEYRMSYNLENDGPRQAWDGCSVMIEVDGVVHQAASIGTMLPFYTHIINEGDPSVQSMPGTAAWSNTIFPTLRAVEMRFKDLANKNVRIMFDLGTDYIGSKGGGVWVDDVVLRGVNYDAPASFCSDLIARPGAVDLGSIQLSQTYCDSFFLVNLNTLNPVTIDSIRTDCTNPPIMVDSSRAGGPVAAGDSVVVVVCVTPEQLGPGSCDIVVSNRSTNGLITVPVTWDALTTVVGIPGGTPTPFRIRSVAPNPFNPSTRVNFVLPEAMPVTADVWSVNGARVRTLARNRPFGPGESAIEWDGLNDSGQAVASGVYFIRIQNRLGSEVARAVLLK